MSKKTEAKIEVTSNSNNSKGKNQTIQQLSNYLTIDLTITMIILCMFGHVSWIFLFLITITQIGKTITASAINSGEFRDETRKIGCNFVLNIQSKTGLTECFCLI